MVEERGRAAPGQDAERSGDRPRTFRRARFAALALFAVILVVRAVIGEGGVLEAHRARRELARLQADVQAWRERNSELAERIESLKNDPAAIEAIARERLGWIRPGEITFLFPYDPSAGAVGDPEPVSPSAFTPDIDSDLQPPPPEK